VQPKAPYCLDAVSLNQWAIVQLSSGPRSWVKNMFVIYSRPLISGVASQKFWGANFLTLSEQQYSVWDTTLEAENDKVS